jgi:polyribonucleotide nucleotidyltransferase
MFQNTPISHEVYYYGQKLTLQTGLLATQATASVLATIGETTVLAAVVVGGEAQFDYFPLQVIYEERMYASGKIKGSRFMKREGRPSDAAVLAGRMIDRSLRSLFDPYIRQDIQVIITVLSIDEVNSPDTLAVIAASSALSMCGITSKNGGFVGPISSIRIAHLDGNLIPNPSYEQQTRAGLDIVISGDGKNIMMVEAGAYIVPEEVVFTAIDAANNELQTLTKFQNEFLAKTTKKESKVKSIAPDQKFVDYWLKYRTELENVMYVGPIKLAHDQEYKNYLDGHYYISNLMLTCFRGKGEGYVITSDHVKDFFKQSVMEVNGVALDADKVKRLSGYFEFQLEKLVSKDLVEDGLVISDIVELQKNLKNALEESQTQIVRDNVISNSRRVDGRSLDETRKITCQVDVLPHTHGSSLFQRGETQVLNVLTVGTNRDAQTLDDMEDFEEQTKRYIHHYNFPSYSVGETGRYTGPGRREIGHGALAEKALLPVLPNELDFPYTLRLVSECLGSNGSTSMASTCASTLSLLAGGVPISDMVAGVAMGLMLDIKTGKFATLTDIQGFEDHHGDMDFKVTGTATGITALQLDNKVAGMTADVLKQALVEAKAARLNILGIMKTAISEPRKDISIHAPRVAVVDVPFEKIGEVIGPSGKIIKGIIAKTQTEIEIDDITGRTLIYGKDAAKVMEAKSIVESLIKEYQPGEIVKGKVYRVEAFGAFAYIDGTDKEGLIHISESSKDGSRVKEIGDVLKIGDEVSAKILAVNERGQISLTLKNVE